MIEPALRLRVARGPPGPKATSPDDIYRHICVTLTPYIKGPSGTLYCIKAQLAGIYLSARPLTWESYDRYMLLRKPSLLLGNSDTNYINHAQIWYIWEIKHSPLGTTRPPVSCFIPHMYLLGMMYVIHIEIRSSATTISGLAPVRPIIH